MTQQLQPMVFCEFEDIDATTEAIESAALNIENTVQGWIDGPHNIDIVAIHPLQIVVAGRRLILSLTAVYVLKAEAAHD